MSLSAYMEAFAGGRQGIRIYLKILKEFWSIFFSPYFTLGDLLMISIKMLTLMQFERIIHRKFFV
jgi:hypothetical protein